MTWFKVDDGLPTSKAVLRIPRRQRCAAVGLWTLAGAWCSKELTDGFVPEYVIGEFGATKTTAGHLATAGLWEVVDGGWQFIGWDKFNPTREQVLTAREQEADRKRKWREAKKGARSGRKPQVDDGSSGECPGGTTPSVPEVSHPESALPDPTRPDPVVTDVTTTGAPPDVRHHRAGLESELPRGPVVDADGWRLVRTEIPDEHPHPVRTDLAIRAGALLKSGTPEADVRAALGLWLTKPTLGPGVLPSLVSEIVRNRTRPPAPIAPQGSTADQRVAQAQAVKAQLAARLAADPKALEL